MIRKVADAVRVAMKQAGIADAGDVHYVQTKTPLLTIDTIREARSRGHEVFTEDTLASMDVSNGTTGAGYRGGPGRDRHAARRGGAP